jgi:hypothetical protein
MATAQQTNATLYNPTTYDETTTYHLEGINPNVTLTIDSIETKLNSTSISYTLKILAPAIGERGEPINSSDYYTSNPPVLRYYLYSGAAIDFDRNVTLNAVWVDWLAASGTQIEADNNALGDHAYIIHLSHTGSTYFGTVVMPKLSEGEHNVTAWVKANQNYISYAVPWWAAFSKTVTFNVDTTPPAVTVLSPTNQTYMFGEVPLDFSLNESCPKISYSLDGMANVSAAGNLTLASLSAGMHNVTVYAWDNNDNVGSSQTVNFYVEASTLPVLIAVVTLVSIIAAGLLVYFVKKRVRKHS